jgi:hypothetical protein
MARLTAVTTAALTGAAGFCLFAHSLPTGAGGLRPGRRGSLAAARGSLDRLRPVFRFPVRLLLNARGCVWRRHCSNRPSSISSAHLVLKSSAQAPHGQCISWWFWEPVSDKATSRQCLYCRTQNSMDLKSSRQDLAHEPVAVSTRAISTYKCLRFKLSGKGGF